MTQRFWRRVLAIVTLTLLLSQSAVLAESKPEMRMINFDNGTKQGFEARAGTETLKVTSDQARSGSNSLLVSDRTQPWHGPALSITYYTEPGILYTASIWVKASQTASFRLTAGTGLGNGAQYWQLDEKNISAGDDWTELRGGIIFDSLPDDTASLYIESDSPDAEFYIDDISFIAATGGGILSSIQLPSLHEVYKDDFLLGTAFSAEDLKDLRFELVCRHFNAMTAGNAMKPSTIGRSPSDYNFSGIDSMIQTIEQAGLALHGHTLVWHSQSANWLNKSEGGAPLTRAEAKANLEAYINEVAGHFAGRVISWDVVNEAFTDSVGSSSSDWRDSLRKGGSSGSAWYQAYENGADTTAGESGADYIYDAFVFARLADPNAILYYNDFNETERGKREAMALMTEELNTQWQSDPRNTQPDRLLIEGIGMQAHYWTDALDPASVEESIQRFIQTGAEISVSELDIPAGNWSNYKELTEDEERKQATLYAQLFQIYKKYSQNIARVTLWGIDDPSSWRSSGSPLPFDDNAGAKLAYYAISDPDGYLAGIYDNLEDRQATGEATAVPIPAPDTAAPTDEEPTSAPPVSPGDTTSDNPGGIGSMTLKTYLIIGGVLAVVCVLAVFFIKRNR